VSGKKKRREFDLLTLESAGADGTFNSQLTKFLRKKKKKKKRSGAKYYNEIQSESDNKNKRALTMWFLVFLQMESKEAYICVHLEESSQSIM
jgi:uncharacterized protein (UPF0128 family)